MQNDQFLGKLQDWKKTLLNLYLVRMQANVVKSNLDRMNSLSSYVSQNVNISNDILGSYYSVMMKVVDKRL